MLNAEIIMYSRSLTKDYRWIYSCNFINETDQNCILNDYREFEGNRRFFLSEKHLIVRQVGEGIAAYRFLETQDKDMNSRRIYALMGCFFSGIDGEIMQDLIKFAVPYLNFRFDEIFGKYQINIPEKKENVIEKIEVSIDAAIDYYKKDSVIGLSKSQIKMFANQNIIDNYMMKDKDVIPLPWEDRKQIPGNSLDIKHIPQSASTVSAECQHREIEYDRKNVAMYKRVPEGVQKNTTVPIKQPCGINGRNMMQQDEVKKVYGNVQDAGNVQKNDTVGKHLVNSSNMESYSQKCHKSSCKVQYDRAEDSQTRQKPSGEKHDYCSTESQNRNQGEANVDRKEKKYNLEKELNGGQRIGLNDIENGNGFIKDIGQGVNKFLGRLKNKDLR